MINLKEFEVWFCLQAASILYGEDTLRQVAEHSQQIAKSINEAAGIPVNVVLEANCKNQPKKYITSVQKPIPQRVVLASLPGCIRFRRRKCGLAD